MGVLRHSFFAHKAPNVARALLGQYLVRKRGKNVSRYIIIETEAYDGFHDRASHASRGKTPRNEVMFGKAGQWYVYFVYGMHEMLNIVCGDVGYPSAVLIRAVGGIVGPARLTKALGITRAHNKKLASRASGLWIERSGTRVPSRAIVRTPRVGVAYAGEWAHKKWRFILSDTKRRPKG
ncbi:MAG TPA: DNA-3-methyladenine glycosylase [Candidatus Paceibacterota bacterium]